jgi:hypothetical protein
VNPNNSSSPDPESLDSVDRRRFLTLIGAGGVAGLAGCGGDDDDTPTETDSDGTPTDTDGDSTPTDTDDDSTPTDTDDGTPTDTDGDTPTETDAETPTDTPDQNFPPNLPTVVTFNSGGSFSAGETTTLTATVNNPYLFPMQSVQVSLEAPGEDWTVEATGETNLGEISEAASKELSWEITPPEDANGTFTLTASISYESETDQAESENSLSITILDLGGVPQDGLEAYYPLDGTTATNAVTSADATLLGGPSTGQPGVSDNTDNAFEFTYNGSGVDDALVSGNQLDINGAEFTLAGWVYHTGHDATGTIFQVGADPANRPTGGVSLEFVWDGETYDYSGPDSGPDAEQLTVVSWEGGGNTSDDSKSLPVAFDAWRFVAVAVNGDDSRLHVFDTNGEISGSPVTETAARGQSTPATFSCMAGDGWDVAGRLDEVYAYSTELTASEITTLYNNSF